MQTLTAKMVKAIKEQVCKGQSGVLLTGEEALVLEILRQVKALYPNEPVAQKIVIDPEIIDEGKVYNRQSICVALTYCYELLVSMKQ